MLKAKKEEEKLLLFSRQYFYLCSSDTLKEIYMHLDKLTNYVLAKKACEASNLM